MSLLPESGRIFAIVLVILLLFTVAGLWTYELAVERPKLQQVGTTSTEQHSFTVWSDSAAQCTYVRIEHDSPQGNQPWELTMVKKLVVNLPCLKQTWPDAEVEIIQ